MPVASAMKSSDNSHLYKQSAAFSLTSAFSRFSSGASMPALTSVQQRSTIVTKSMSVDEGDPELDYQPAMNQFSEEDNILHLDLTQWDRIVEESYK